MKRTMSWSLVAVAVLAGVGAEQRAQSQGGLRIALLRQPFVPNGTSNGPATMANGGIQSALEKLGATVRVVEIGLTPEEDTEYGGWKRLGFALGHLGRAVAKNEREGYFNVGLLGTCPSMPGMVAGLQQSGPTPEPLRIGMFWLDAHPDFNTPETTRSGSLGGMPVAVATGRCLTRLRLDAGLDPPLSERHVVMGGVRLTDPLEQRMLDDSFIEHVSVTDLRENSPDDHEADGSLEPPHRQDLRPHRHGRARSPRGDGPRKQGSGRAVERAAGCRV